MTGTAPDVAGVVVGWRTWRLGDPGPADSGPAHRDPTHSGPVHPGPTHPGPARPGPAHPGSARLRSPVKVSTEWPSDAVLVARCELRGHGAPEPSCTCGLYAARDPADVGGVGFGGATLLGCVAMWGTVIEGERGWRAGLGRPVVLFCGPALPEDVRTELAAAYRVPVHRLHLPVAVTVEQAGTGAAGDRLRAALGCTSPDRGVVDAAARAFVDAAGKPMHGPVPRHGNGRVVLGTALLAAVAASALLLPTGRDADLAPATPERSATPEQSATPAP